MNRICAACGSNERHYAKGLCRNCYNRLNRNKFNTTEELIKYDSQNKRNKAIRKRRQDRITEEQIKIRSTNEYIKRPSSVVSKAVIEWYYNTTDKFLLLDFENERDRTSAYNTIYAMTKRRHSLPVRRWRERNRIVVERLG